MEGKAHFVDILEPRRTQTGIFKFMTKDWYPTRTQVLDKNYTPQDLKDITARSLYLDTVIEAESAKTGVSKEKLKKEVLSYIEEIGLDKKMHVIRWLGMFAIKIAFNMKIGIYVNEPAILRIKSMMGKHPVLFLPTHRSYADFCIMTYLCYHYDIQFPAVASGMDFYSMAVVGQVLRETCAFYIRRSLAGAALYAAALRQYVRTLVATHDAPIEFFLEGTRSRSNKSMPPKFGMLSMALAPLVAREVPDVALVPVHISYDRLLEQAAFACEHLGVPKPKESTRGLLKWLSTLNEEFGNMYINFCEPISAGDCLRRAAPRDAALKPVGLQQISGGSRSRVSALGWAAAGAAARAGAAGPAQLVAAALAASLHAAAPRPTPYRRLLHEMDWLKKVLEALGMIVLAEDLPKEVERILRVHARSWALDGDRCLRLRLHAPAAATKQGVVLSAAHVRVWLPVIELQLNVNPLLPRLLPPALLALLHTRGPRAKDELRRRYDTLRALLRYEFIYDEQFEDKTFEQAFEFCVNWGVVSCGEGGAVRGAGRGGVGGEGEGNAERLRFLLSWAAWPALTTLKLCMDVTSQRESCSHEEALQLVQAAASESGAHPYCVSRIEAGLTLRALLAAGALEDTAGTKTSTYRVVPAAMARYQSLVAEVVPHFVVDFSENHPVFLDERARSRL